MSKEREEGLCGYCTYGASGAAVTCKEPPWMEAEPWSSGRDHPVPLLVSLPLQVGGPHPVFHLRCFPNPTKTLTFISQTS